MASPDNLLSQLADRTATFLRHSGLTQGRLCRYLSISDSSLSQFLNGNKGLAPEAIIKLCQALSLSHQEIQTKFAQPISSAKILNLQQSVAGLPARPMRLDANDGAWVPGQSGVDPSVDSSIVDPGDAPDGPTAEDLALLRNLRKIHRQGIKIINNFINSIPNRASVNRSGTTEPTNQRFNR
jgi:transcriptional regulator with XRE-family HTH domain